MRIALCLTAAGLLLWAGYVVGRRMPCKAHSLAAAPAPAVVRAPVLPTAAPEPTAPPSPRPPAAHQSVGSEPIRDDSRAQELGRALIDPDPVSRWRKLKAMGLKPSNDDFRAAMPASVMQRDPSLQDIKAIKAMNQDIDTVLKVLSQWVAVDAAAGAAWIMQLPELPGFSPMPHGCLKERALTSYVRDWTRLDAAAVEKWIGTLPSGSSSDAAISACVRGLIDTGIVETDPQRIASWCTQASKAQGENPCGPFAAAWYRKDMEAATAWINSLPPSWGRDAALSRVIMDKELASQNPKQAMEWAASMSSEFFRSQAVRDAMITWAKQDPAGASQFLSKMEDGNARDEAIRGFAGQLVSSDPATAMGWAEAVSDMGTRQTTMETVASAWLGKDRAAAMDWIKKGLLPKTIEDLSLIHI